MFGEHAADHRSQNSAGHPYAAEIGLVLSAFARAHHVGDHGLHDRHDAAAAKPLQAARENQHGHVRRDGAQQGAGHKQAQRDDDHGAAAVDVAQRAEHRRHRGRGQQIRRDHPGQVVNVVELPADGRQGGRHDGLVERRQKHRQHQADDDGADFILGERRRRGERRRIADVDDLGREVGNLFGDRVGRIVLVGRSTALPFEIVHLGQCLSLRAGNPR